jgi:hypothetical protein
VADPRRTAASPLPRASREQRDDVTSDPAPSTTPQHDEATDSVPATHPPQTPYKDLKMPHERDESAVGDASEGRDPSRTRPVIRQAHEDLAQGKQDTDCYDAVAPRYEAEEDDGTREGRRKSNDEPGRRRS